MLYRTKRMEYLKHFVYDQYFSYYTTVLLRFGLLLCTIKLSASPQDLVALETRVSKCRSK